MYKIYKSTVLNESKPLERTLQLYYDDTSSFHRDWGWINDSDTFTDSPQHILNNLITSPSLTLSANSSGSLEFEVNQENDDATFKRMADIVIVKRNDVTIWEGRVISEETDFWGNKKYYCEGIMSCLNDTRQPQKVYKNITLRQVIENILSIHNQKVSDEKKIQVGIVTANNNSLIDSLTTNYDSTWEILKKMVDDYEGYLFIRYDGDTRYLDYRKECPRTSSQVIEFGENLLDFTKTYDMSSLVTVLLPLGKKIASSGQTAIGDVIDSRLADGHYIDPYDYNIYYDPNLVGAYSASNTFFPVEAGKTYYISCRNHDGRIMFALKDSGGNLINYRSASTGEGMTDLVEYKLEVPKSDQGASYQLAIAGFGYDIQPRVNSAIEADENFDKFTTVESVNGNSLYVINQEAVSKYGWIEKQLTWEDIEDANKLKEVAEKYLKEGQFDEMTLDISAIDLQLTGATDDGLYFLDEVRVLSKPNGLDKVFPLTEMTIDMSNPENNKYTLGSKTKQTLTGVVSSSSDDIFAKLNALPSQSATLKSAKDNATLLINNATSGIFQLERNEETGTNVGYRISNVENWKSDGAKGWRFNIGGLGYYGDGFNKPITLALTGEDGGIVANSITTGQMLATRIRGGVLGLGHWQMEDGSYIDGSLQLADKNGKIVVDMNQNGAYVNGVIESNGIDAGGGPETVHIENGWIYGSDMNAGHISVDTNIEYQKGVSIDTNVMALCVFDTLYTARYSDISDLEPTIKEERDIRFQGVNGYDIILSIKNGLIVGEDIVYEENEKRGYSDTISLSECTIYVENGLITNVTYNE